MCYPIVKLNHCPRLKTKQLEIKRKLYDLIKMQTKRAKHFGKIFDNNFGILGVQANFKANIFCIQDLCIKNGLFPRLKALPIIRIANAKFSEHCGNIVNVVTCPSQCFPIKKQVDKIFPL